MKTTIKIKNPITKINCISSFRDTITNIQKEFLIDTMHYKTLWISDN